MARSGSSLFQRLRQPTTSVRATFEIPVLPVEDALVGFAIRNHHAKIAG